MEESKAKIELKRILASDIGKLFKRIDKILEDTSEYYNEFIIQQGRYNQVINDFNQGVVNKSERDVTLDKLRLGMIDMIDKFDHEDLNNVSEVEQVVKFSDKPKRYDQVALQLEKTSYAKFFHLSKKGDNKSPLYTRFIPRLNKSIDVFDEYVFLRLNKFSQPIEDFETTDRTSGTIDLNVLHPWQDKLNFADEGAQYIEQLLNQTLTGPSNVFVTAGNYYNAFQPGNNDVGMKMEKDTKIGRLIVDFSSIPGHEEIINPAPKAYWHTKDKKGELKVISRPSSGIFYLAAKDLRKGEVIKIDFEINWNKVS